jgi:hypothetical protein
LLHIIRIKPRSAIRKTTDPSTVDADYAVVFRRFLPGGAPIEEPT